MIILTNEYIFFQYIFLADSCQNKSIWPKNKVKGTLVHIKEICGLRFSTYVGRFRDLIHTGKQMIHAQLCGIEESDGQDWCSGITSWMPPRGFPPDASKPNTNHWAWSFSTLCSVCFMSGQLKSRHPSGNRQICKYVACLVATVLKSQPSVLMMQTRCKMKINVLTVQKQRLYALYFLKGYFLRNGGTSSNIPLLNNQIIQKTWLN